MQLAVDEDLALGDVAREIGDRVRDVVVGHGQDGDLRDRAIATLHAARALVDGGQVGVHVTGVASSAGHLFSRGGDFAEGVAVGGQVGQDDEDVLLELVGVVFRGREGEARRDDALDAVS